MTPDSYSPGELARYVSTTLVVGILDLFPDDEGTRGLVLQRVGDSSAWVRTPEGGWRNCFDVKNDGAAIASSSTAALPAVTELEPPHTTTVAPGEVAVLMTDGVGDPLGDGRNDFGAYLAEVWEHPPSPLAFAAQVDFARRSFDDDRTALAIWPG